MEERLQRLTLHQVRVFRAAARHRNFTLAAGEIGLTQSAVSAQIRELSSVLGAPLFEVLGRKVHLTAAGRLLESHAVRLEAVLTDLVQDFSAFRDADAGSVRIGASSSLGTYYLPPLIADFLARRPRVELSLEIGNSAAVEERLLRSEVDLAFLGAAAASPALRSEPYLEDEIVFACAPSHPLAGKSAVPPERIATERLIVREPGSATRRAMEDALRALWVTPRGAIRLGAVEAIKQSVLAGLGISWFSAVTVRRELEAGHLARIRFRGLSVSRTFYLVRHRRKKDSPALQAFAAFALAWRSRPG